MIKYYPVEEMPETGEFLVYLERPMLNTRYHTMTRHPNLTIIGGHFNYDCPKVLMFAFLNSPDEYDNYQSRLEDDYSR